jgi:hypothetical protein
MSESRETRSSHCAAMLCRLSNSLEVFFRKLNERAGADTGRPVLANANELVALDNTVESTYTGR